MIERSRRLFFIAMALLVLHGRAGFAAVPTTRPIADITHVMIISVDGLRPDVLLRNNTPILHALSERGCYTFWAQTVPIAITLPSHTSMLTGVSVEKHGINFNDERATTRPIYPNATTIFEIAHANGYSTAMVSGKSKFEALAKPGTVDWLSVPDKAIVSDSDVATRASAIIADHKPDVIFVHFPGADGTGHSKGWGSREQIAAVEQIDADIGTLFRTLDTAGLTASTAIIVTADHGGSGRTHGAGDVRSLCIPWIVAGPGIRKGFDLTLLRDLTVNTTDTFATSCFLLGLQPPPETDGKAIYQIVDGYELMRDDKNASFKVVPRAN